MQQTHLQVNESVQSGEHDLVTYSDGGQDGYAAAGSAGRVVMPDPARLSQVPWDLRVKIASITGNYMRNASKGHHVASAKSPPENKATQKKITEQWRRRGRMLYIESEDLWLFAELTDESADAYLGRGSSPEPSTSANGSEEQGLSNGRYRQEWRRGVILDIHPIDLPMLAFLLDEQVDVFVGYGAASVPHAFDSGVAEQGSRDEKSSDPMLRTHSHRRMAATGYPTSNDGHANPISIDRGTLHRPSGPHDLGGEHVSTGLSRLRSWVTDVDLGSAPGIVDLTDEMDIFTDDDTLREPRVSDAETNGTLVAKENDRRELTHKDEDLPKHRRVSQKMMNMLKRVASIRELAVRLYAIRTDSLSALFSL
ncbi:hypothetical protein PUNSTDRAFT_136521 [Punctularia strigosozonata HHB-11173 SS5]|uniref:uncharacterized protein n=1 Tax=Punctularia strigosozonata (strain HHB-11173) TaxID=741275 RepID=UPI000441661C|nr:uncharacterized protein PUNSTDRAFT_136521 [Punctularia strigosozonata HHB-11173 SS5]EIN06676.1 hypothetical protein PUNSTDRAFT_136521 [Punctularia strigosozonata HHB-11173 SS5]